MTRLTRRELLIGGTAIVAAGALPGQGKVPVKGSYP